MFLIHMIQIINTFCYTESKLNYTTLMENSLEYQSANDKTFIYLAVMCLGMYLGFITQDSYGGDIYELSKI